MNRLDAVSYRMTQNTEEEARCWRGSGNKGATASLSLLQVLEEMKMKLMLKGNLHEP